MTYDAAAEQRLRMWADGEAMFATVFDDTTAALDEIARLREIEAYWKQGDWVLASEHHAEVARLQMALDGLVAPEELRQWKEAAARYKAAQKQAFTAGWKAGYTAGGEHDCRMFEPSAERDWERLGALAEEPKP